MSQERLIIISETDLDNLIYKATRSANDNLFKGIANFLYEFENEFKDIHEKLEYLQLLMKQEIKDEPVKPIQGVKKEKKSPVKVKNPEVNPKLAKLIEEIPEEDKGIFAQAMQDALKKGTDK